MPKLDRSELLKYLTSNFSYDEAYRLVAVSLKWPVNDIIRENKGHSINMLELVGYAERRGKMGDLLDAINNFQDAPPPLHPAPSEQKWYLVTTQDGQDVIVDSYNLEGEARAAFKVYQKMDKGVSLYSAKKVLP